MQKRREETQFQIIINRSWLFLRHWRDFAR